MKLSAHQPNLFGEREIHTRGKVSYLVRLCKICGAEFLAPMYSVRKGYGVFCSGKCFGESRKKHFESIYGGDKRLCRTCKEILPVTRFSPDLRTGKRQGQCKKCKSEWMRLDRVKNPLKYKAMDFKQYGLTPTQYQAFLKDQNGVCAICKKLETTKNGWLHVDHDHLTGKVRGLLCGNCNVGIGNLGEDLKVLESAIRYLQGGM